MTHFPKRARVRLVFKLEWPYEWFRLMFETRSVFWTLHVFLWSGFYDPLI